MLVDTGVIVALLDRSERSHRRCVDAVADVEGPLVTCEAVVAEACYLLRGVPGAAEAVLENAEKRIFDVPFRLASAAKAIRNLMRRYVDVPMDFADACLVHLAEQLEAGRILTLDQDFRIYRWRRTRAFECLPG